MKLRTLMIMMVLGIFAVCPPIVGAEGSTYILAVVPQGSSVATFQQWTPFVQKLSREAGVSIQIKTYYASIPQFESDLKYGVPDFAFMNPYHMVMAHKAQHYVPLVRDKTPLRGILVVRKNSAIKSVRDLNGKEIAFPSPNAFGASLYLRALLTNKEKIHFTPRYVQTHGNVYRQVVLDMIPAGGGIKDTLMAEQDDTKNHLTILYETPPAVSHPLAAHPRVPEDVRKKVIEAIMKLAADPANRDMFDKMQLDEPVAADYQRDYAPLAKLQLDKFVVTEGQ
jgi:phosphonate transport system substrate-binding protein